MRITRSGDHIILQDRPGLYWALGLFLLAGGLVAIAMPLGLATNASDLTVSERLAITMVGVGGSAGALWWLGRSRGSRVDIDLAHRRVHLVRFGTTGRETRSFAFDDLDRAEVEEGTDSEGGAVWRPAMRLRSGELVLLSELWTHDRAGVAEGVREFATVCQVPWDKPSSSSLGRR
jgi:hypothetical protein